MRGTFICINLKVKLQSEDERWQLDSPAEMNPSILSLKGWRFSSVELAHTFFTSFSQAGRERREQNWAWAMSRMEKWRSTVGGEEKDVVAECKTCKSTKCMCSELQHVFDAF